MPDAPPPVVTFTTDFGVSDSYVGAMKGALLRRCPRATLVDVTHAVPRHDVLAGSVALERAVASFPDGTTHVAVVDPGVGTDRRVLVARWAWQTVVCPDNGLLTWAWRRHGRPEVYELTWRPPAGHGEVEPSHVFHGRDILAPAAGLLAGGSAVEALARPLADDPVLLDAAPAADLRRGGVVLHVDHFGNATTNVPAALLAGAPVRDVRAGGRSLGPVRRTYQDVGPGEPLALVGSSGLLEVAVNRGSAADVLGIKVGDGIEVLAGAERG